jgi:hypothetical protein
MKIPSIYKNNFVIRKAPMTKNCRESRLLLKIVVKASYDMHRTVHTLDKIN